MLAPDPLMIREASIADVTELGFPVPPDSHPLVWEDGDHVDLRARSDIEARVCVLQAVLAAAAGLPADNTWGWLGRNGLHAHVTGPEKAFLLHNRGGRDLYLLHTEAICGLAWVLGVADQLDPSHYVGDDLATWVPDVRCDEPVDRWRERNGAKPRPADEVAVLLDLYYCLDWGHMMAIMDDTQPPGKTLPYVVGQRRWALEWAAVLTGRHHGPPANWDEVDLTS